MGLYEAFKILGWHPYHGYEITLVHGIPHMEIHNEVLLAECNPRLSGIKRYSRDDFEKWFAAYDAVIGIPSACSTQILEAYLDDPNVKFLLTERDPDSWVRSLNGYIGDGVMRFDSFPLALFKWINRDFWHLDTMSKLRYFSLSDRTYPGAPGNMEVLRQNYLAYMDRIKNAIPPGRLTVINLDDEGGLNWEKLCGFLEVPVPTEPFPDGKQHRELSAQIYKKAAQTSMATVAVIVTFLAAGGTWLFRRHQGMLGR